MRYHTFTRTWWADKAETRPKAGRKFRTGRTYATEEEARAACHLDNSNRHGGKAPNSGPRGLRTEYEGY